MNIGNNLDIFICAHKDFNPIVTNNVYKIIDARKLKQENYKVLGKYTDDELAEWYHIFYIAENIELKDYIGICHYRRYFSFLDDIPNIDELFKTYDLISINPVNEPLGIEGQYKFCHNIDDLYLLGEVLKEKFSDYYEIYNMFINSNILIHNNMLIMKKEDFLEFVEFIKNVLIEYLNKIDNDIDKRIFDNLDKYLKPFYPQNLIKYQKRLLSYIIERLTNIYLLKNFNNIYTYDLIMTEDKYNNINKFNI